MTFLAMYGSTNVELRLEKVSISGFPLVLHRSLMLFFFGFGINKWTTRFFAHFQHVKKGKFLRLYSQVCLHYCYNCITGCWGKEGWEGRKKKLCAAVAGFTPCIIAEGAVRLSRPFGTVLKFWIFWTLSFSVATKLLSKEFAKRPCSLILAWRHWAKLLLLFQLRILGSRVPQKLHLVAENAKHVGSCKERGLDVCVRLWMVFWPSQNAVNLYHQLISLSLSLSFSLRLHQLWRFSGYCFHI